MTNGIKFVADEAADPEDGLKDRVLKLLRDREDAIAHAIQSSQVLWETTRLLHQARADRDAAAWEAEALRAEVQKLLGDGASE